MQGLRRQKLRDRARTEHAVLLAFRRLCAEVQNRFSAADALTELGLGASDSDTLRDLACALVLSDVDVMPPDAPYLSDFEDRLLALVGDRQREPRKRVGLPVPSAIDAKMIDDVAGILNEHDLRISYRTIICADGPAVADPQ